MMKLTDKQRQLLKNNIDYIEHNEFQELFDKLDTADRAPLSEVLSNANIDFLPYMKSIPERLFGSQSFLESIVIPHSIERIDMAAFFGCKNLQHVTILGSDIQVGPYAFGNCPILSDVQFNSKVKFSPLNPFNYNYELDTFTLQRVINQTNSPGKTINLYGYGHLHKLKQVTIPAHIGGIDTSCFESCTGLEEVNIEYGCKEIFTAAFQGCIKLRKVTLPKSIIKIGVHAFSNTPQLTEIIYKGSKDEWDYMITNSRLAAFDRPDKRSKIQVKGDNFDLEM